MMAAAVLSSVQPDRVWLVQSRWELHRRALAAWQGSFGMFAGNLGLMARMDIHVLCRVCSHHTRIQ